MTYDQWLRTEPPERWIVCTVCDGEGEVPTGRMSHSVNSATIDPPWEVMETCPKCNGACGFIDDVEAD
jgi:DnaJ-class molecular chaperone